MANYESGNQITVPGYLSLNTLRLMWELRNSWKCFQLKKKNKWVL